MISRVLKCAFGRIILSAFVCLSFATASQGATLKIGGTGSALGTMRILAEAFAQSNPDIAIEIPASLGSKGGIKAVLAGALDIGLSARPLKADERKAGASEILYAKTPFTLITSVSESNPNPRLSSREVVQLFSGAPHRWPDGTPVRLILRIEKAAASKILMSNFAGMEAALAKAREIPGIPVAGTVQDNLMLAERLPGSLTTGTLAEVMTEHHAVTSIVVDGMEPSLENLATGAYRLSQSFYLVTGPEVNEAALHFIRFIQSHEGSVILEATGNLAIADKG